MNPILRLISAQARMNPEKPAILLSDQLITYRILENYVTSLAQRIQSENLSKDSVVGISIDNPVRHIAVCLALMKTGHASTSLKPETVEPARAAGVTDVLVDNPIPSSPGLSQHVVRNEWFLRQIDPYSKPAGSMFRAGQIARVFFSSGSTGRPKAIGFTEEELFSRVSDRIWKFGAHAWDRALCMAGLSTEAGYTYSLFGLCLGRTISFSRTPEEAVQLLSVYSIEQIRASPAQLRALVTSFQEKFTPLPRLVSVHSGGGPLSYDLIKSVSSLLCHTLVDSYGSTEAGTAGIAGGDLLRAREDSPASYFPLADIQCVSKDGKPLENGTEGTIRIRSNSMGRIFDGNLYPDPALRSGQWFYPGDTGYINEEGLLVLLGRDDHLMNVGGYKISPELIEDRLRAHSCIRDAVIVRTEPENSLPARWVAAIVSDVNIGTAQVREWCAGHFPSVEIDAVVRIDSIPRNEFGKVSRENLRQQLSQT